MMKRRLTLSLCAVVLLSAFGSTVRADEIKLWLDLWEGCGPGLWRLSARVITTGGVDGSNGIAEVHALIDDIDFGTNGDAITIVSGIGATDPVQTSSGPRPAVLQTTGGTIDILYSQDLSDAPSVIGGVGTSVYTLIAYGAWLDFSILPSWGDDDLGVTSRGLFLDSAAPGPFGPALEADNVVLTKSHVLVECPFGDVNHDGFADGLDIPLFVDMVSGLAAPVVVGDISGVTPCVPDGFVDGLDIPGFVNSVSGLNCEGTVPLAAAAASVPEPSSLALVGMALLGIGYRRRRKS